MAQFFILIECTKQPFMWVIAFFSILLGAIVIYALLVKKSSGNNNLLENEDPMDERDKNKDTRVR